MKILSINFGHDASLSLFIDSELISFLELERETRLKHTVGVHSDDIKNFLIDSKLKFSDIDYIALSGTQWYKAKHSDNINIQSDSSNSFNVNASTIATNLETGGTDNWYDYKAHEKRLGGFVQTAFPLDVFHDNKNFSSKELKPFRMLIPYSITIDNCLKPALFVPHQIAHACYGGFYRSSSSKKRLVISHDGGWPHISFNSGGIFLVSNEGVFPIADPSLSLGQIYQIMGEKAGFKPAEAPGKLMGLASYGIINNDTLVKLKQIYYQKLTIANNNLDNFMKAFKLLSEEIVKSSAHIVLRPEVKQFQFDFKDLHQSVGIAAYTQKLVEQIWSETIAPKIEEISIEHEIEDEISLVGGFSLNCPSNSLLQSSISKSLKPLSGGADMGTSIGAGAYLVNIFSDSFPINNNPRRDAAAYPPRNKEHSINANTPESLDLVKINISDKLSFYADQLLKGKIFCHFEGASEVGPRALGHRSIIAHAQKAKIRDRINANKRREMWRPLAPIVRIEDFSTFFSGSDNGEMGDFMLNTYRVLEPDLLEAVTHADRTARVQTVYDGTIHRILTKIQEKGAVPVVVNTSFNVAGEPLIETIENAVQSFKNLNFDYLYLEGEIYENR